MCFALSNLSALPKYRFLIIRSALQMEGKKGGIKLKCSGTQRVETPRISFQSITYKITHFQFTRSNQEFSGMNEQLNKSISQFISNLFVTLTMKFPSKFFQRRNISRKLFGKKRLKWALHGSGIPAQTVLQLWRCTVPQEIPMLQVCSVLPC